MRITLVTLGLVALISAGPAAQSATQKHTFLSAHQSRLSIDFGTKQALKNLPQVSTACAKVHPRHELLPRSAQIVELPIHGGRHRLNAVPVTSCPVR